MRKSRKDLLNYCAVIGEDDGIDPRRQKRTRKQRGSRKNLQLCGQVARALNLAFANTQSEIINSLYVVEVLPIPNITRLVVTVVQQGTIKTATSEIIQELAKHSGQFRFEITSVIHRKKAPTLTFVVGM